MLDAEDALVESACRNVVNLQGPRNPPAVRLAASKIVLTRLARKRELFSERIEITGAEGGAVQVAATVQPLLSDAQVAALSPEQLEAAIRAQLGT